ncbi:MAG: glycosyltransferase family 9 protein [Gemmatimonadales bacterium]
MPSPRILLVRFSSLGDVLLTTPLIRALRLRYPDATLTAVTKEIWAPLLSANPHLDEVVSITPADSVVGLARALRGASYTHRLDLHSSARSRMLRLLVPGHWHSYHTRRRERRILIHQKRDTYGIHVPVAERYFEAASDLDVRPDGGPAELFLSPAAEARADGWLAAHQLDDTAPLVALAPGAAHATKRWPLAHWRTLATALGQSGVRTVVLGNTREQEAAACVVAASPARSVSAAGALDLQASGALLRRCRVLISGDTGPMHLATAVGTPVVALFGPTVELFGFYPYQARATILERPLACRPCSSKGGPHCPLGHHRCLTEILPEEVMTRSLEWCQ